MKAEKNSKTLVTDASCSFENFLISFFDNKKVFLLLHERGIDTRRVIVDDSAALYHIGEDEQYPPMLIIVSDGDIKNRYEQTVLLVSTLKHFGHSENVKLKVMNGTHCAYVSGVDQNGDSVLGKLVAEYKAHIGVDKDSGTVHTLEATGANEHDVSMTSKLLTGEEEIVYGDSDYLGAEKREEFRMFAGTD